VRAIAAVLAMVLQAPPGAEGDFARTVELMTVQAEDERRIRLVRSAVALGVGSSSIVVGAYVYTTRGEVGPTVHRAAIVQMLGGSGVVVESLIRIARPGPLQVLTRHPAFLRMSDGTATPLDVDHFEQRFLELAREAKIERRVVGSLNLAGGLAILVLGSVLLFQPDVADRPEGESILGASMLTSGLSYAAAGVFGIVLPSEAERAARAYVATRRWATPPTAATPRIGVGMGGITLTHRF